MGQLIRLALLVGALTLAPHLLAAQGTAQGPSKAPRAATRATAGATAMARYARAIVTKADSVVLLPDTYVQALTEALSTNGVVGFQEVMNQIARETRRLTGDFDAVVPPPDLVRLHEQLLESLRALQEANERILSLAPDCQAARSAGLACSEITQKERIGLALLTSSRDRGRATTAYAEARERATRMLAEAGVTLPKATLTR